MPDRTVLAEGNGRTVLWCAGAPDEAEQPPAIVAKYYPDAQGARTAFVMQSVCSALDAGGAACVLSVPRALGYDPERQLLLQHPAPGVRLDALLSGAEALSSLHLTGRALADLHAIDVVIGSPAHMADHLRELVRPHPRELANALPLLARRVDRLLRTLLDADARWPGARRHALIHRDVHPKQLFRDGERLCLIDWDLAAHGDAALDLGNLSAYLKARRGMCDDSVGVLLHGYAQSGGADVLERVPVYEAFTYLRLACKRFRLDTDGWREECGRLIARAEQALALV
jgi:aminoglycoside phosphotransferase (APT) family kinase protein